MTTRTRANKDKIPTGSEIISMVLRNFLKLKKCRQSESPEIISTERFRYLNLCYQYQLM